jgi:hypothetical protein
MQAIDMLTGVHGYDQGLNLFGENDGVIPRQNSAVNLNGNPSCMIVEWPSNVSRLLEVGPQGQNTYPLFTSPSSKSQVAVSSFHDIGNNQKQLVAFMEDYRAGGDYPYAVAQNLILDSQTGVPTTYTSNEFILYPNPALHSVNMRLPQEWLGSTCTLYDRLGSVIDSFQLTQNSTSIDLHKLPSGVYQVGICNGKEHRFERLIIE